MQALRRIAGDLWEFTRRMPRAIPEPSWFKYAALRLGTFTMSYAACMALIVVGFTLSGIVLSFGIIFVLIPFVVLLAIRISGALVNPRK